MFRNWRSHGVTVQVSTRDITIKQGCFELINEANKLAPVDGIFNLAVILKDALFIDQSQETFNICLAPKAQATIHLDQITKELCPQLRYFVVFSSVSCGRGNPGQTNYGMANSIMERICEKRKREGFPGLAIQWGAIGDVGLVAKMQKENRELVIGGTLQQKISSCFEALDKFLKQDSPVVASMVVAEKIRKNNSNSVVNVVVDYLGIKNIKSAPLHTSFAELGMDSIMGTEMIHILEKDFSIYITAKELRNLTFAKLMELESQQSNDETPGKGSRNVVDIFLNYIPDEGLNDSPTIKLASKVKDNENAKTVILLPGVEGVCKAMEPFSKQLQAHILGVQYINHCSTISVEEYAKMILPHIEETITKQDTFYIISYSFGTNIATELVCLLEAKGFKGHFVAIDGSPDYLSTVVRQNFPIEQENEFQTLLLFKVLSLLLPIDNLLREKDKFLTCKSLEERFELAKSYLPPELAKKEDLTKNAFHALCNRLTAIAKYKFNHVKLKSQVHLFKAKQPLISDFAGDYKLSQICEQPVQVTTLEGDHFTILQHDQLANGINRLLKT